MTEVLARIPPHNLDAERALLGAVLLEGRSGLERVLMSPLRSSDFYTDAHRATWEGVLALARAERPVDLITLSEQLRMAGELEAAGGPAALADMVEQASIMAHLDAYVDIVVDHGRRRDAIQRSARLIAEMFNADTSLADGVTAAQDIVESLGRTRGMTDYDPAVTWQRIVAAWSEERILTGWSRLDALTGGLTPAGITIMAGRTSHGKTSLAAALLKRLAEHGTPAEYFTLEDSEAAITRLLVANDAGVSARLLKDGVLAPYEFEAAEAAVRRLQALPLKVRSLERVRALDEDSVLSAVFQATGRAVVVDHLQKIETRDRMRTYGIERVLNRLHTFAIQRSRVVILLYQLGRDIDARKSPPVLSDLRDSAAAEFIARQVWGCYWPSKYHRDRAVTDYELHVLKQNDGPTGVVPLRFDAWCGRFTDAG